MHVIKYFCYDCRFEGYYQDFEESGLGLICPECGGKHIGDRWVDLNERGRK